MPKIKAIQSREILDSRGTPTIETTIWSDNDHGAVASVPSGASTGKFESLELRDNDPLRFSGKGVLKAIRNVNEIISPRLIGRDPSHQGEIDQILINLDNTPDKSKLGANAILSVSQAVCELGAAVNEMQAYEYIAEKYQLHIPTQHNLPTPIFNLINGGKHGAGNLDFQEFHLIPTSKILFSKALEIGDMIYQKLEEILIAKNAVHSVGDEGGFAPNLKTNLDAMELMVEAIRNCQLTLNQQVFLGLDIAASNLKSGTKYRIKDSPETLSAEELTDFYINMKKQYNLFSVEDPLGEDDWDAWTKLTMEIGSDTMVVGDDLLVTNKSRLEKAIKTKACNSIIIKPNQVGTITEAVSVVKLAKQNNISVVVSHRSGDTDDIFIADLAVGIGADYVKFGAPARGERVAKYNRLSLIELYLRSKALTPNAA